MKLDGDKVRAARGARPQREVWQAMRHLPHWREIPRSSWVSLVERGDLDPSEQLATALAAALGVGLSELLPKDAPTDLRVQVLQDDLHRVALQLQALAYSLGPQHLGGQGSQHVGPAVAHG